MQGTYEVVGPRRRVVGSAANAGAKQWRIDGGEIRRAVCRTT